MKILKVATVTLLFGWATAVSAEEYSILPVEGSAVTSADGRTWMVDVIDTDYQRGTFILSLVNESYESVIGNRVLTGNAPLDLSIVELPAVSGMADVVAWNQGSGGDGGDGNMQPQSQTRRSASGGEYQVQANKWMQLIKKYCEAANKQSALALTIAIASCTAAGGQHSGGSTGVCGIGASTGSCSGRAQMEK